MMNKKVEICFCWWSNGAKTMDFIFLRFKSLFCQSIPTNPPKVAEEVCLSVLQHPTKFQAKILTGKFYS